MKKKVLLGIGLAALLLLLAFAVKLSIGLYHVNTKCNEEIEQSLQDAMTGIHDIFVSGIENRDYEQVRQALSPRLMAMDGFELVPFVDQFADMFGGNRFVVQDQYYSTLFSLGGDPRVSIVPSLDDNTKYIINGQQFFGAASYSLFSLSTNAGFQHLLYLGLSEYDDGWKINSVHFGAHAFNNVTAPQFYELGKRAQEAGRRASSVIYAWAVNKLLRPAPFLQYPDEGDYAAFVESATADFNAAISFPRDIAGRQFSWLQVLTTNRDGLIPTLAYVTDRDFADPQLGVEARNMKDAILATFPGLEVDFKYVVLRAVHEPPTDPNRNYPAFSVVLEIGQQATD